jgi:hypothetical protein
MKPKCLQQTQNDARALQSRAGIAKTLLAALCFAGSSYASASDRIGAKPDALLQIDLNRAAVVERIVANWSKELAPAQLSAFKDKLNHLRADQLLAANISGSFDGVLEVMDSSEKAAAALSKTNLLDEAKTVGDAEADVVYTPVTPCRFLDTRGLNSPVNAGGAFTSGQIRPYQVTGACNVPVGASAVVTQIIMIQPSAAGDIEVLPQGGTFGGTVAMVFQANVFSSVSLIAKLNVANGQFATQIRGPGGHVAMDILGYYKAPNAINGSLLTAGYRLPVSCGSGQVPKFNAGTGGWDCGTDNTGAGTGGGTVTSVAAGTGLTGGTITSAGTIGLAATQLMPTTACASGQIAKWNGTAWACAADATGSAPTNVWTQGGNAFGATGVIGTTDAQNLTVQSGLALSLNATSSVTLSVGSGNGIYFDSAGLSARVPGAELLLLSQDTARKVASVTNGSIINNASGFGATVSGGGDDLTACRDPFSSDGICSNDVTARFGTVGGGRGNAVTSKTVDGVTITGDGGTISGGEDNFVFNRYGTISGGRQNRVLGQYSTVGGGFNNRVTGNGATVPGGIGNIAIGDYSFAAGSFANASTNRCVVFGLWENPQFEAPNCFGYSSLFNIAGENGLTVNFGTKRSDGGGTQWVNIGPLNPGRVIEAYNGAHLTTGGVWTSSSDRARKENFGNVSPRAVLDKLLAMPVSTWNYIEEGKGVRRMGAMAQDFFAAFGLGHTDKAIGSVDAQGVAFAAIQGLNQKLLAETATLKSEGKAKDAKISALEKANEGMLRELAAIKKKLGL